MPQPVEAEVGRGSQDLGDLPCLWRKMNEYPIPEASTEVLLTLGPRISRHLPEASYTLPMTIARVGLGILLAAKKEDPASQKRGIALLGEGFPVMLREHVLGDLLLPFPIGWHAINKQVFALENVGRKAEALAWMREYVPRFEAAICSVTRAHMASWTAQMYGIWARIIWGWALKKKERTHTLIGTKQNGWPARPLH